MEEAKSLWDKLMGPKVNTPKGAPKVWPKGQCTSRETDAPAGCVLIALSVFLRCPLLLQALLKKGVALAPRPAARATRARRITRLFSREIATTVVNGATKLPTALWTFKVSPVSACLRPVLVYAQVQCGWRRALSHELGAA